MILHLQAFTDAAGYAIFDPTLAPKLIAGDDIEDVFERLLYNNAAGNLILYSDSADGASSLCVYVDDDPSDELRLRAANAARGVCRFPGGQIAFSGVEHVAPLDDKRPGNDSAELPPGDYFAEGFDVQWEPGRIENELRAAVGTGAYRLHTVIEASAGIGCVGAAISVLIVAIGAAASWTMGSLIATGFVALFAIPFMLRRLPAEHRFAAARQEIQLRFPPVVLVLRRVPDGAALSGMTGLAFGVGHVRRQKAKGFEVVFPPEGAKS